MTCVSKAEQIAKGLTYECFGNCSSSGFRRNSNNACEGLIKKISVLRFFKNLF